MKGSTKNSFLQLSRIETNNLFRNLAFYFLVVILVLLVAYLASVPANSYQPNVQGRETHLLVTYDLIERGHPVLLGEAPGWFNPDDYPLIDLNGAIISENVEVYKQINREHFQAQVDSFTAENGDYSFPNLINKGIRQVFLFLVIFPLIMAIILFTTDYRNGSYRLMVSRGVKRSTIVTSKFIALIAASVIFTLVAAITLFVSIAVTYNNFNAVNPADFSMLQAGSVIWVFLLISLVYVALGGLMATTLASATPAMLGGLVLAFLSISFFNITPCDQGFLAAVSPVTLGHNIGSILQTIFSPVTGGVETSPFVETVIVGGQVDKCFRNLNLAMPLAVVYASVFTFLTYLIFNKKELKG
ncbi:MAG: ABC transporter permease subunit [Dehalococcoidales bacterium]|nr:ABC transporter permease subunit [Dehalococcoidales bacterium]